MLELLPAATGAGIVPSCVIAKFVSHKRAFHCLFHFNANRSRFGKAQASLALLSLTRDFAVL
jgi:hypothetical protein